MIRLSLRAKMTLAMALVALTVAAATALTNYRARSRQLLVEFQSFVRSAAGVTALALAGREDLDSIRAPADAETPAFQNTRRVLAEVRRINRLNENEIYLLRPLSDAERTRETEFIVMLQPKPFIGARYVVPEENWALVSAAWRTGEPQSSAIYTDAHGRWISGYAPALDRAGRPVALVEVDAEISRFLARQREEFVFSLLVAAAAFALAMLPGLLLANRLTRGLGRLAAGMRRFQAGDARVRLQLSTGGDEVQRLGEAFNEMILSLAEKLALLPFVSRFTAEAVSRSRGDPALLSGMEQSIVVLFSDLRGFTRFSEDLEAAALVRELNALLAAQAEAVLSAGGDVDKFVGDSVMAVFLEDEEANAPRRALACAEEMMRRVAANTAVAGGSALALGVGIHRGRAVVGAVGSDVRRDFTAIGHTVNLASRLCGKAAGWEVLVSGDLFDALSAETQGRFARTPPLEFKNVQRFVPTYALGCRPALCPA